MIEPSSYLAGVDRDNPWPGRGGGGTCWSPSGCHSRASITPGGTSVSGPKKLVKSATEWL